jgi:hypothetical protein
MKPAGRRLILITAQIGRTDSTCRQYRSSGQDRATDQALRASEGITWPIMGSRAATDRALVLQTKMRSISTARRCSSNGRLAAASAVMSGIRVKGLLSRQEQTHVRHTQGKWHMFHHISLLSVVVAIIPITSIPRRSE